MRFTEIILRVFATLYRILEFPIKVFNVAILAVGGFGIFGYALFACVDGYISWLMGLFLLVLSIVLVASAVRLSAFYEEGK